MTDRIRSATACLFLVSLVTLAFLFDPSGSAKPVQHHASLTFGDRVAYQYAIEEVYWHHRIWPKENASRKPSLDAVMSRSQIERKVEDYLRASRALADYWQRPITAEQLQAEMDRMAQHTQQPEVLRELFDALGNDPFVISECLARPVLAERLLRTWYAHDERIHGDLKRRAEADVLAYPTVEKMKQTSGKYSEFEFVESGSFREEHNSVAGHAVKLSGRDWNEAVQRVAAMFHVTNKGAQTAVAAIARAEKDASITQIKTEVVSPLQEEEGVYYATAVLSKKNDRLNVATVTWPREPLESWLAKAENQAPTSMAAQSGNYTLPKISEGGGCIDDTWTATAGAPSPRFYQRAVWTGTEMIIWGGYDRNTQTLNTGSRYSPATDSWIPMTTNNAPQARAAHTAIWTGNEMIVWGGTDGNNSLNTGGRYNPASNTWIATSTAGAPQARADHTAIWTSNEMIVWGGSNGSNKLNTGGRYNPSTDSWTVTSTANAPTGRYAHTAVWTGSEVVIWGGYDGTISNTGGRYNPSTNSWTATSTTNAPTARRYHTAVWTGSEMIIWGGENGSNPNTGGRYNPSTDSWTATSTANAPDGREVHTAVWTGGRMIVWGGFNNAGVLNTGGRYDPGTNSWAATATANAPSSRYAHTAIWTGSEMIVWGGSTSPQVTETGGKYNPNTDTWIPTSSAPSARYFHTAVWTGAEMVVWGGFDDGIFFNTGGKYNPTTDSWAFTSTTNAPDGRREHTAVWTGNEMIVWGGAPDLNTGGKYNPASNTWTATSTTNAPTARFDHTAIWTGREMIVWGGTDSFNYFNTGGRYNPSTDTWNATSISNAPTGRSAQTAVWTGSEMIVWGGYQYPSIYLNTGGRYDPGANSWLATSMTNAPAQREAHAAVWTGSEMIVWGGIFFDGTFNHYLNTGGRYNPGTNGWTGTSITNAPTGRLSHTAIWTGSEMIVWGGVDASSDVNTGGRYNPSTNSWIATSTTGAPTARTGHTAVWTGSEMIVWGGEDTGKFGINTGGTYCAQPSAPVVQSAVSRKAHGGAGSFDVNLPLSGTPGIECRTGGGTNDYAIMVTFLANVSVAGNPQAAVTSGTGIVGTGGVGNGGAVIISGNAVTIPLTNVANAQSIQVTLYGVNGSTDLIFPMSVLIGDTNANTTVNAADVAQTKARLGQTVNATNFRSDVNANGSINAADTAIVKQNSGTSLPP